MIKSKTITLIQVFFVLIPLLYLSCSSGAVNMGDEQDDDMMRELVNPPAPADTVISAPFAFRNVKIVPMISETVLESQTVLVEGNRIVEIGPVDNVVIPDSYEIYEGDNTQYLMPGLNDMHTHIGTSVSESGKDDQTLTRQVTRLELLSYLVNGVTTVLNNGDFREPVNSFAHDILEGRFKGPTMFTANFTRGGLGTPDGGPPNKSVLNSESSGREFVKASIRAGYDFMKLYNYTPPLAFRGVMDEADFQGIPVIGHIPMEVGAFETLNSGMVLMAHAAALFYTHFGHQVQPNRVSEAVNLVTGNGTYMTTTLRIEEKIASVWGGNQAGINALLNDPAINYVHSTSIEIWERGWNGPRWNPQGSVPGALDSRVDFIQDYTRQLYDAGATLIAGTDSPTVLGVAGFSMHEELKAIERLGLTHYQVLEIATKNAGLFLADQLPDAAPTGTIETGKQADLLLLNADPFASLDNVMKIEGVMARGAWYKYQELKSELDQLVN